ncbi:MAG: OsmC family protein [Bacteroidia bacterium]
MATSIVKYLGGLRTEATHLESGNVIITDAPKDNNGNGEAFSPTDLTATSLACCMITVMGIVSKRDNTRSTDGAVAEVTKVMYAEPRRIGEIHIKISMPPNGYSDKDKKILENAAYTCPVAKSLHPDIKQLIEFTYL